jgi:GNAT superfamily N-acetyltransferase
MAPLLAVPRSAKPVKATLAQRDALARTLARALYHDPAFAHTWRDPATRLADLIRFFRDVDLPDEMRHDETYTNRGVTGVAIWVPPGDHGKPGLLEQLGQLRQIVSMFGRDTRRALRVFSFMEENHPEEDHYYLSLLGVEPEYQGQGIGSTLMQPVLDRADDEGVPAYVEATSERNRPLYRRHGFEDLRTVHWPDDGPPLFLMWREPR